jgi:predicted porin
MRRFPPSAALAVAIALFTSASTTAAFADDPIVTKAPSAGTQGTLPPWPTPGIPALNFAPPKDPCTSAWEWVTTTCQLTWWGVRVYGIVDAGGGYQTNGVPFNGTAVFGSEYLIQKNSNRALWTLGDNGMSNSVVGVQAFEPLAPGWAFVFDYSFFFNPESGQLESGIGSIYENRGIPLASQTANYDSSRNGQPWNNTAYFGFSSPTYGTLTFFRQWALTLDAVYYYDPMANANAFSLIGFSGTTCGVGVTEDCRATTSAKYRVQVGPVRLGALWQFGGYDLNNASNGGWEGDIGADFPVGPGAFSFDALYGYMRDAVSTAITASGTFPMTLTLSNDQSAMLVAKWTWGPLGLYAGFEWIQYAPPSDPQTSFFYNVAGICTGAPCGNNTTISNTAYSAGDKTLYVAWTGAKYTVIKDVDLIGAYYHYTQPAYGVGCTVPTAATCFGTEDVVSGVIDWRFMPRWDTYIGTEFSQVNGGLSSGYLARNNIATTAGVRLRF